MSAQDLTPEYSIPIRWCVVGNDVNGNGVFDADVEGERMGAPAWYAPEVVNEATTDEVLWRRHERPTDNTYLQAGITLRSALLAPLFEDPAMHFPVIPDPDFIEYGSEFDLAEGLEPAPGKESLPLELSRYGDVNRDASFEIEALRNSCQAAWEEILGTTQSDVGIMAVVVARFVRGAGDMRPDPNVSGIHTRGLAPTLGGRFVIVEDNAFSLPGSELNTFFHNNVFPISDHVDRNASHEFGHAWTTAESPSGRVGLTHTSDSSDALCAGGLDNVMRTGKQDDVEPDELVDNFHLSDEVDQITTAGAGNCETVDQVQLLRDGAPGIFGCTRTDTGGECNTPRSDAIVDVLRDVPVPALDLSLVFFKEFDVTETTLLVQELLGSFEGSSFISHELEYFWLLDLDGDPTSGGSPAVLGAPTTFTGAELVAKVTVTPGTNPMAPLATPQVWVFANGTFTQVVDDRIQARVPTLLGVEDTDEGGEETRRTNQVEIELPTALRGTRAATMRLQAITRGGHHRFRHHRHRRLIIDRVDSMVHMTPPTYPLCSVTPNPAGLDDTLTVVATDLLPDAGVHVLLGPDEVARGATDGSGTASVSFPVPFGAKGGLRLITVGNDNTAITADCTVRIEIPPDCENDTTPPVFTHVPRAMHIDDCTAPDIGQARAKDLCGVRVTNDAPHRFPRGRTIVTWTAEDPSGNVATSRQLVIAHCGPRHRPWWWP